VSFVSIKHRRNFFDRAKHVFGLVHFARMRNQNHYVSLRFNMASVDIKKIFENKYDYTDNYELQQHQRSSVAVEWYKKCITTASSTVLLGITRVYT